MPSINSSRQPGTESSGTIQSPKNNRTSTNNRSAKNRSRSANSSDSENARQKANLPPDPASSRGEPEDEIDFSED
ncbi:MAG: hypothetical protein K0U59_09970, partial [Gammaproteobacteria bacterium]|nr:hypothetical protein [Gammaproteobacteria bacterium]